MNEHARLRTARVVALATPLALLGGAYAFQYIGGLYPCEMCWWQRYAHFAALALAFLAWIRPADRAPLLLAGLALAVAAALGAYHAGVEYHWWEGLTACTSTAAKGGDPLAAIMNAPLIRCDQPQWTLFGVSLAGWNFVFSGAAALAVFVLMSGRGRAAREVTA
ncbi:MAG: disulfide bond formation protein B [Novosphingobium sp.]|nr:disulfide bond formation protein B [Novosphingobium sp.]